MASITASRMSNTGLAAQESTASTHPYTCNSCQVAFRNSELQRGHMRSDWHRYNLKRRVTSLPPISAEIFTEKALQAQATTTAAATKATYEKTCTVCARTYFSANAYQNHLGSLKHKNNLASLNSQHDDETTSVMSSTFSLGEPIESNHDETSTHLRDADSGASLADRLEGARLNAPVQGQEEKEADGESVATASSVTAVGDGPSVKRCLFCNHDSETTVLNANHMERIHGMFIPEKNFLVDLDGLIGALNERIFVDHECLYCGKLKPSVFGLQTHMRDKGHCKIPFSSEEEQLEIGEFYDFTSTYSDVDEESDEEESSQVRDTTARTKAQGKRHLEDSGENDREDAGEGDGWETDSSASSLDSADLTAVPLEDRSSSYEKLSQHRHHSRDDPRPHRNKDGFHSHAHKHTHAAFYSDYELYLPSGRTAGHRSLNRYYRQNLHSHPSPEERQQRLTLEGAADSDSDGEEGLQVVRHGDRDRGRALASRANAGGGLSGLTLEKKQEVQQSEKRSQKAEERARRKFQWGNNKQSNLQKHFRDPLLQ